MKFGVRSRFGCWRECCSMRVHNFNPAPIYIKSTNIINKKQMVRDKKGIIKESL